MLEKDCEPVIDFGEIGDDETWELFARDYLADLGFVVEIDPGRGPDQGRDLIVVEQLCGRWRTEQFRWLVSCKYFTQSNKSVGTGDEQDIPGRLAHHNADGFLGFYSTLASASLVDRLKDYARDRRFRAYEIFDRKKIEARFFSTGSSKLALRYFPESYGRLRPIQKLLGEYVPLCCEICGFDLLQGSVREPRSGNVIWAQRTNSRETISGFAVCKGDCDKKLTDRLFAKGQITLWEDIGDLTNPALYLKSMVGYMNQLKAGDLYSDAAHEFAKTLFIACAQRTLREITADDYERLKGSALWEGL